MRIAVWHNLPSGGGKRALYYHVKGLVERGHSIEVWSPPTADLSYLPLSGMVPEHVVPFEWRRVSATGRLRRAHASYRDAVSQIDAMDRHCRNCAEEINRGNFDLLFAGTCEILRTAQIGRYVSAPKALYLQEPYRWLYEALPTLPWLALPPPPPRRYWWSPGYVLAFLEDLITVQALRVQAREELTSAQAFDAILVNSLFSRESVLRAYGLDARVCYLGVDTGKFVDRGLPRENLVVGIGAFVPPKNVEFVIRAVGTLTNARPRLMWIGNFLGWEPYLNELRGLADSLGVDFEPRVAVSDEELVEVLNRAAVMAYAPRLEPFGLVPLEANACGLPVVAVAEGGVRETIVDGVNGLLVEGDASAMGAAIGRLLADRGYARDLGECGRRLVEENWSLRSAVDRLESRLVQMTCKP